MDDFSKTPMTIGELRANRDPYSDNWTLRDMLISVLRDIDSGKIPEGSCGVLIYKETHPDSDDFRLSCLSAKTKTHEAYGMMFDAMCDFREFQNGRQT